MKAVWLALRIFSLVAIFGPLSSRAFAGAIVYQQPPVSGTGYFYTSSYGNTGGYRAYDDFSLGTDADIGAASWRGVYRDGTTASNNPVAPNSTAWTFAFFSDASGPSSSLFSITVSASQVTSTFVGYTPNGSETLPLYDFHVVLPVFFHASAGTTYWFSVLSVNTGPFEPHFSWTGGNLSGTSMQRAISSNGSDAGSLSSRTGDHAFSLEAVPEPASTGLILTGAVVFVARRRQRRLGHRPEVFGDDASSATLPQA